MMLKIGTRGFLALTERVDPEVRTALEEALWLCRQNTHYEVEAEHLLCKLVESGDGDLPRIFRRFDVDTSRLSRDLVAALDQLKRGNTSDRVGFSPHIPKLLSGAWYHASVEQGEQAIRSGNILCALLGDDEFSLLARDLSAEFARIDAEQLLESFADITAGSGEARSAAPIDRERGDAAPPRTPSGKQAALEQYTIDLTQRARAGEIDPVTGRDSEIRLMIDILMRRRQNNPILTGEPGVGKTAVVEGFAVRIAEGDVPEPLRNTVVRTLDLGLLQAGAGVRGEFENRLKGVIREVRESPMPVILFIDEAHTMIGAGGAEGGSDAANLLKPALARGELRTIAATTWGEYKKYFEKDAALARRFQVIKVEEPAPEAAIRMLRAAAPKMEEHHRIRILPEAIEAAVRLSDRYLSDRQLPDKAVSVLDTASSRLALSQGATPPLVEDAQRERDSLEVERRLLLREQAVGAAHDERLSEIEEALHGCAERLEGLQRRWEKEKELVRQILELREKLELAGSDGGQVGEDGEQAARSDLAAQLRALEDELAGVQGEEPLMRPYVDANAPAEVIASWTGIPLGRMVTNEVQTVLSLESLLAQRVVGQDHALRAITQRIQTSRANLSDPKQPVGVFLLVGPSGVGKTETGLALAELLYGGERNLISINMSEYQSEISVTALKGAPPGYVGYGQGGALTEPVRKRPYSVILLDETEKAHPDVMELFYQVFDKGVLEDDQGRLVNFKNTIILLTSNLATDTIVKLCADEDTTPDYTALAGAIHPEIVAHFKPALVGRMTVIPYYPLRKEVMRQIAHLKVDKIRHRLAEHHGVQLDMTDSAVQSVLDRCTAADTGARNIDHVLTGTVMPELSSQLLRAMVEGKQLDQVQVDAAADGGFRYTLAPSS